ncbi:nitronate monooxygenase family protein [Sphingomonas sp. AOB5]|uniref:NAD(P)H-dependent flavin oxidoreductase n=1 Tax=Sphingomonas sp. AOB5 TaxID=3034017 RepID=UPI0023F957E3|nr:nitronate monooxygenase family protein [Sphingomonas sp. AOB5]MDF7774666.1 nitronate monooxygenase family protein [Sphingomonas sp. AOB5]
MIDWPDTRFLDLTGADLPIVQAPMAGAGGVDLAVAAMRAGAVGSLPCAMLTPMQVILQSAEVRAETDEEPLNLNFFCHTLPEAPDESAWLAALAPYFAEEGVEPGAAAPLRLPFDAAMCEAVEASRPEIVSFHFGLPEEKLLDRVRKSGALIVGNATTAAEAGWLAERGCDAIIAQGAEAGGHAGWFLDGHRPMPLAELLRTIRVDVPMIAAGGIVDGAGIAEALRLGASAVQIGTAYLATPEATISRPHRKLLGTEAAADADFTNLFSGREARGIRNRLMRDLGPVSDKAPAFPHASNALVALRRKAEAEGRGDYSPLWAGSGAARVRALPATELAETLAEEALALLG